MSKENREKRQFADGSGSDSPHRAVFLKVSSGDHLSAKAHTEPFPVSLLLLRDAFLSPASRLSPLLVRPPGKLSS